MNTLVWFRQDLRTLDNLALTLACQHARETGGKVHALFIASPAQWQQHHMGVRQQKFMLANLNELGRALAALGIPLELQRVDLFKDIPDRLTAFCAERDIGRVFAGSQIEIDERRRDLSVIDAGVPLALTDEHCILPPGTVVTQGQKVTQGQQTTGAMYRVFTPFARRWRELAQQRELWPIPAPEPVAAPIDFSLFAFWDDASVTGFDAGASAAGDYDATLWSAGQEAALGRLQRFAEGALADYGHQRDYPAVDGTSSLSPYLVLGVLSPRQCLARLLSEYPDALVSESSPARAWLNELVWREFYRHLMVAFPGLSMGQNFNALGDGIRWRNHISEFEAWKSGRTGYPLIDAAMRQLHQTGWMHNRLRMVVASFLTKHLLIDWRWGEQYFREQLIDGCLAANNGGWQWAAGTGCDAQPYFRIFNPMSQSEKFDPDGRFIRKYLPEIAHWPTKALHQASSPGLFDESDYPLPLVEHSQARLRALEVMSVMKKG